MSDYFSELLTFQVGYAGPLKQSVVMANWLLQFLDRQTQSLMFALLITAPCFLQKFLLPLLKRVRLTDNAIMSCASRDPISLSYSCL